MLQSPCKKFERKIHMMSFGARTPSTRVLVSYKSSAEYEPEYMGGWIESICALPSTWLPDSSGMVISGWRYVENRVSSSCIIIGGCR